MAPRELTSIIWFHPKRHHGHILFISIQYRWPHVNTFSPNKLKSAYIDIHFMSYHFMLTEISSHFNSSHLMSTLILCHIPFMWTHISSLIKSCNLFRATFHLKLLTEHTTFILVHPRAQHGHTVFISNQYLWSLWTHTCISSQFSSCHPTSTLVSSHFNT